MLQLTAHASKFSFVYIQGDKETPFYVKLEDEMLPRYGKNYCIIPQLAPGIIHIKILFQQHAYPAHEFTVVVPEEGSRGFLLMRKGNEFSLFDIQQQFYLQSGNKPEDDHAPAPTSKYVSTQVGPTSENITTPPKSTPVTTPSKNDPNFMDVELKNNRTGEDNSLPTNAGKCKWAIDADLFDGILRNATERRDEVRLKYLMTKASESCFNTTQISILTKLLSTDPERYTFLKEAYPKTVDSERFPTLEALLSTDEWKGYFKHIIQ
jgi:hypothetical protein